MFYLASNGKKATWYLGQPSPTVEDGQGNEYPLREVSEFWADGKELDYIRRHFTNIPMMTTRQLVVWKGEMAQFIYDNLT